MKYIVYAVYNLLYQVFTIGFLFYANTFFNQVFIPDGLRWKNGKLNENVAAIAIIQGSVLLIEAAILSWILYKINARFLKEKNYVLKSTTTVLNSIITVLFISYLLYVCFK